MTTTNIFTLPATSDALRLSVMLVAPSDATPRGIVQLSHGMCEHKERYVGFMQFLADAGFACIAHDHRGHGGSVLHPEDLGYFYAGGWQALVDDIRAVQQWAEREYPHLPCHLIGHSMGSLAVRCFVKRHPGHIASLTVCGSPSLHPATSVARWLAAFDARLFGGRHRPRWIQQLAFGPFNRPYRLEHRPNAWVCSDRAVVEAYNADPLCQFVFTANAFFHLFSMMLHCYAPAGWTQVAPSLPVLFISGGDDVCRISDAAFHAAAQRMREAGFSEVEERLYPAMRHEILNEAGKEQVWTDVLQHLLKAQA